MDRIGFAIIARNVGIGIGIGDGLNKYSKQLCYVCFISDQRDRTTSSIKCSLVCMHWWTGVATSTFFDYVA